MFKWAITLLLITSGLIIVVPELFQYGRNLAQDRPRSPHDSKTTVRSDRHVFSRDRQTLPRPIVSQKLGTRILKGTTFFGGAGIRGKYNDDMVRAMEEAGIRNVRKADRKKWSNGMLIDAVSVPFVNNRDKEHSDLAGMGMDGEQFNLVGYSYGGLQAAQAAANYADDGGKVDNLVLISTPIEKEFLETLQKHPNIKSVKIIDLTEQDDPIHAGMSDWDVVKATPKLLKQFSRGRFSEDSGHFYYSDEGLIGERRRRDLAEKLKEFGLE